MPPTRRPASVLLLAAVLASTAAVAGCGEEQGGATTDAAAEKTSTVSDADQECRDTWGDLARTVAGRDESGLPSRLAPRWQTVAAGIDYYQRTATEKTCGSTLEEQKQTISDLEDFNTDLARWDMQLQLARISAGVTDYLASPLPEPGKPAAQGGRNTNGKATPPPTKKAVRSAVRTLRKEAALAAEDQTAGWGQANATDVGDDKARAKAIDDLKFLTGDGTHAKAADQALSVLRKAVAAG